MKTPIQQLKENYYKMSESEFHYWMSQNIETLLKEERNIIVKAYNRDVINKKQNWAITDGEKYYNLHYSDQKYTCKDIKYGLIVVDSTQESEMMDILHFVGYWTEPTKNDANLLREELMTDEEFGLTEIAHRLDILPAPDYIVKEYVKDLKD
jgi:hypothetical protein